jgi:sulfatase maturation enzyme AslB (radical SAM superfamily)
LSNSWCPEIYRSVYIDRVNDDKIRVAPCCQAHSKIELVDTFNFETSPYLTRLRTEFDQGQKPKECDRCWKAEEIGHKSRRESAIEFFNFTGNDTSVKLESFDYSATWACNLACVMCSPALSSTWAAELDLDSNELFQLGRKFQRSNDIIDWVDFSAIKKVHFNGGEPMLNNDQVKILKKLDDNGVLKDTLISYNTNGTVWPSEDIFELWKKAKLIKLYFSIDATDAGYEYVRYPGNWNEVTGNMLRLKNLGLANVMFGFNVAIGGYNIFEVADVWKWFNQHLKTNIYGDTSDWCWQLVDDYDFKYLKEDVKNQAIEKLSDIDGLSKIVDYLNTTLGHNESNNWIDAFDKIDKRRGTSWKKSLQIGKYY